MKTDNVKLLKYIASFFRNSANGHTSATVDPIVLRYITRKDLIEIITSASFTGSKNIKEIDLLKMENEELLTAIGSELTIISFIIDKWSKQGIPTETSSKTSTAPVSKKEVSSSVSKKSPSKEKSDGT